MRLALIEWVDTAIEAHGWVHRSTIPELDTTLCVSAGVLLSDEEDKVKLCLSLNLNNFAQAITIPKSCIKRTRYLEVRDES